MKHSYSMPPYGWGSRSEKKHGNSAGGKITHYSPSCNPLKPFKEKLQLQITVKIEPDFTYCKGIHILLQYHDS